MMIPWKCRACGASGELDIQSGPETWQAELAIALHGHHRLASPDCTSDSASVVLPVSRAQWTGVLRGWTK